jgi:hypothetical protein
MWGARLVESSPPGQNSQLEKPRGIAGWLVFAHAEVIELLNRKLR